MIKHRTFGEKFADFVAEKIGSWRFAIGQTVFCAIWITINSIPTYIFDHFPYILMNLGLSYEAIILAIILLISQNRQASIDRKKLETGYRIDVKTEREIEVIHGKVDKMHEKVDNLAKTYLKGNN